MKLVKLVSRASAVLMVIAIVLSGITAMAASPNIQIESKEPEIEVDMPTRFPITYRMKLNDAPLGSFEDILGSLPSLTNETVEETQEEEMDIDPLVYYTDRDDDPLDSLVDSPDPDWSVIPLDPSLVEYIFYQSKINNVDPFVVIALIQSESGFHTDVVSCVGCYGLMQLHPLYYPEDMTDPYKNIQYGVETIGNNLKKTDGNYIHALSMYANGHIGTKFDYQYDVMERAEQWRTKFKEANIL